VHFAEHVRRQLDRQQGLRPFDRALYHAIADYEPSSLNAVSRMTGASRSAVERACKRLAAAKWLVVESTAAPQRVSLRPVALLPAECQAELARLLDLTHGMAGNRGELLMKSQLDLYVRSRAFMDNARPSALTNPLTRFRLELDRYYFEDGVAFEYQGQLHHDPPEGEESEKHNDTQVRDMLKESLCVRAGIELIAVTAEDLRPGALPKLIPSKLSQRRVDTAGIYYQAMARLSTGYADWVARQQLGNPGGKARR